MKLVTDAYAVSIALYLMGLLLAAITHTVA